MIKNIYNNFRNEKHKHQEGVNEKHSELINSLGYSYIETVKEQNEKQSYRIGKGGQNYVIKFTSRFNDIFTKIYSEFLGNINYEFQRLVIPECVECGNIGNGEYYVILEWIEGKNFNNRWSAQNSKTEGGNKIKKYTIPVLLELIDDLLKIDANYMVDNNFRKITPVAAKQGLLRLINRAQEDNIVSAGQSNSAREICYSFLEKISDQPYVLSNGDFQFLNFIEISDQKTALIDWDGARVSCFEKEHCVALQWLLMWNNGKWQNSFLDEAIIKLNLDKDIFRGVILMLILRLVSEAGFSKGFYKAADGYLNKILDQEDYDFLWDSS